MDRATRVHAYVTELQRLRLHLRPGFGSSRLACDVGAGYRGAERDLVKAAKLARAMGAAREVTGYGGC